MRPPSKNPERFMRFFEHFDELRSHFVRMLWVFMAGFVGGYYLAEPVMAWLRAPLFKALPIEKQHLYFTHLFENFLTHLKIAGVISIFALSPYFFYEIWSFIKPGLRDREKKYVVPFVTAASFFFVAGAAFAYYVIFPVGFKFFVEYGGPTDVALLTIDGYYSTCLKLMLLFGLGFELPVLVCLLGVLGVVDSDTLKAHRRTAILGISVASALFAPPDAISMLLMMAPLILLYEASIWVVQWMGSRKKAVLQPESTDMWVGKSNY